MMIPHDRGDASSLGPQHDVVRINDAQVEVLSALGREPEPDEPPLGETLNGFVDGPLGSGLVQRFIGLGPVLLLSLAVVTSALIGLDLSHDSSSGRVADRLGCRHISSGTSETGVSQEMCEFNGARIVIWSFSHGSNVVYPLNWMASAVQGPTWIVGCGNPEDCVAIRDRLGGQLVGAGWMGSSVELQ